MKGEPPNGNGEQQCRVRNGERLRRNSGGRIAATNAAAGDAGYEYADRRQNRQHTSDRSNQQWLQQEAQVPHSHS